jgi:hypothetical protein
MLLSLEKKPKKTQVSCEVTDVIRPHSRETQFTEQPPSLTLSRETSLFFLAEVSCGAFFSERALRVLGRVRCACLFNIIQVGLCSAAV